MQSIPSTHPLTMADGWLDPVRRVPSPNFKHRPDKGAISLLVVHSISLPPEQFGDHYIEQFFCNKLKVSRHPYFRQIQDMRVSAHALITRRGDVVQFVNFNQLAWHAGKSNFGGRENCNDFSIGIELEGSDAIPYTLQQYNRLAEVAKLLIKTYPGLHESRIVGHSDIAPKRKTDPGGLFKWNYFRGLLLEK